MTKVGLVLLTTYGTFMRQKNQGSAKEESVELF